VSRTARLLATSACVLLAGCSAGEPEGADFELPGTTPLVRPDTPGNMLMFNFDPSDLVETHGSPGGRFLVHYTRMGLNAVPAADTDASGVPDFVEEVAGIYDDVLLFYRDQLGFRVPLDDASIPDNGGDDRFDVYLVDFAGTGDGNYQNDVCVPQNLDTCAGYMIEENDYAGYGYPSTLVANRILASHELFHAVQSAYDKGQGSIFGEGTAVWATEQFDPSLNDFEGFIDGYLDNPDRSLDIPLPGPVDPFSYGSAIFFQFLEERYGGGTVRALWERCENGAHNTPDPIWFQEIDPLVKGIDPNGSFASAYLDFATWNLFTGPLADPARGYANGAGYARVKMTDVSLPYSDDKTRIFYASTQYYRAVPAGRTAMTAALIAPDTDPSATDGLSLLFAAQRGPSYDPLVHVADVSAGIETMDTAGADLVVIFVVNTLQQGESRRPALCIGTTEEVAACRAALAGDAGTGAGGAGGGGAGGAGGGSTQQPTGDDGGCGCRTAPTTPPGAACFSAGALIAIAAHRFTRRRRTRARAATAA
jgi:MYXO-CTERM domain-containing protein